MKRRLFHWFWNPLFLIALLTDKVSSTKTEQHGNAATQRCCVLVASLAMTRKVRHHRILTILLVERDASVQQASVLCKGTQSHHQDDCDCHDQFFHRILCFLFVRLLLSFYFDSGLRDTGHGTFFVSRLASRSLASSYLTTTFWTFTLSPFTRRIM